MPVSMCAIQGTAANHLNILSVAALHPVQRYKKTNKKKKLKKKKKTTKKKTKPNPEQITHFYDL